MLHESRSWKSQATVNVEATKRRKKNRGAAILVEVASFEPSCVDGTPLDPRPVAHWYSVKNKP